MSLINFNADQYMSISDVQCIISKSFIDDYPFVGNESILDLGCGDAKTTCFLATKTSNNVVGIDNDKRMLFHAENQIQIKNMNKISVKLIDIHQADVGQFDLVASFFCLHMLKSLNDVFATFKNNLKVGGHGFVVFPTDDNYFLKATRDLAVKYNLNSKAYSVDGGATKRNLAYYTELIENQGFHIKVANTHEIVFQFDDSDQFDKWLSVMLKQIGLLSDSSPGADSKKFINESRKHYDKYLRDILKINKKNIFIFQINRVVFCANEKI